MQGRVSGVVGIGAGVEVEVRAGIGVGVEVNRLTVRRTGGFFEIDRLPLGREVENRRRGLGDGDVAAQIPVEEPVQRDSNGLEGVEVGEVGFGEGVPLADCLLQEPTPLAAEHHRREVVELGACAAHCCSLHATN